MKYESGLRLEHQSGRMFEEEEEEEEIDIALTLAAAKIGYERLRQLQELTVKKFAQGNAMTSS